MSHFTPICVACQREMRCRKNDYLFADYHNSAIWAGDMYECESCKQQVVVGVGRRPVARSDGQHFHHYESQSNLTLYRELDKSA